LLVLTLLTPAVVVMAQGPPPRAPTPKLQVRGVVVDDGKPVAKAIVTGYAHWTYDRGSSFANLPERTTDEKGEFTTECHGTAEGLTVSLRARQGQAFTAGAVQVRGKDLKGHVRLRISLGFARAASVRVLDEDGKPIAGASVTAKHQPSAPEQWTYLAKAAVKWPDKAPAASDKEGRFLSARCLDPDGRYQLVVTAEGFLEETTAWKAVGKEDTLAFGDVVLSRMRPLEGEVVDQKGKPVTGAKVTRDDHRQRYEATTDAAGRFTLKTTFFPPGFVFVEKEGYRFHGQRCDKPEKLRIVLTRREEPAPGKMAALPPTLPLAKRRELAEKLLAPTLARVLPKGSDDDRLRVLQQLAERDPARALEELERRPFKEAWYDGYVRRGAVKALRADLAEAKAVAGSIKDPRFRATCLLDLHDSLPADKKADRLAFLNEALVASRAVEANDHRILNLSGIARRLHATGEKDRADKLLREGQAIAKELPTAGWSGYARGAFAEDLALIDLPGALALMKDLKDPFEYIRHHANLAQRLAGSNPAEAERLLGMLVRPDDRGQGTYQRDQYAIRICHRMAKSDLERAKKITRGIGNEDFRARAYAVMAQALAKSKPKEAVALLDEAFTILARKVAAKKDSFNRFSHAASLAGLSLGVAEEIDPALVPEFFWRAVWLHAPGFVADPYNRPGMPEGAVGSLALTLARYDRGLALAIVGKAQPRRETAYDTVNVFRAVALADPERAVAMVASLPAGRESDYVRDAVVTALLADGGEVDKLLHNALAQWHVDTEDL
jgi:hypothetical protein